MERKKNNKKERKKWNQRERNRQGKKGRRKDRWPDKQIKKENLVGENWQNDLTG